MKFIKWILFRWYIPKGIYCYDKKICPFWHKRKGFPHQESGYCDYLRCGDAGYNSKVFLLWDQCKECGIRLKNKDEYLDTQNDSQNNTTESSRRGLSSTEKGFFLK